MCNLINTQCNIQIIHNTQHDVFVISTIIDPPLEGSMRVAYND